MSTRPGCEELTFHLLGSAEVDETFRARLDTAPRISPAQMRAVESAMERAVGESSLRLDSQMILLASAVSGAPFLGLLGTVWGVMDTFGDVAAAGSANLTAMAPGVSAALITTVTGLLVAIPAMFGYNFLVTSIRGMIVDMDNFAGELASEFEHRYVDHGPRPAREEINGHAPLLGQTFLPDALGDQHHSAARSGVRPAHHLHHHHAAHGQERGGGAALQQSGGGCGEPGAGAERVPGEGWPGWFE